MVTPGPDFQQNTLLYISQKQDTVIGRNICIHTNNLIPCSVYFTVRKAIPADWINDRDQFLSPKKEWECDKEFKSDCLAFTLFHPQNRITSHSAISAGEPLHSL